MQVTSLLTRSETEAQHAHDHPHDDALECGSCGTDHEHTPVRLPQTLVGLIFVINAFVVDWLLDRGTMVASFSAMIGAIILGAPIVWTSFKDIRKGILSI